MTFFRSLAASLLCLVAPTYPQTRAEPQPSTRAESAETFYRNSTFGFRYRVPFGWVDRTKDMQPEKDSGKGEVLLAVFERPPQATGEGVNSAVVIAAEDTSAYPGLKKAEDYLEPLNELMTAKGFKPEGDSSEVFIDQRRLVRADFSKSIAERITMHQATLVMLAKAKVVSLTFIADSDDALDNLIAGISFAPAATSPRH